MSKLKGAQIADLIRKAGWWGSGTCAGGLFFLLGGTISLFEGDMHIALQSLFVAILLGFITYRIILR